MSIFITNRARAVPKGVVWFGILLSLSLAVLGLLASYLVSSLNGDYQEIVSRQLPALAIVRNISQANAVGRRLIEGLPDYLEKEQLAVVNAKMDFISSENTLRLERLQQLLDATEGRQLVQSLLERRKSYRDSTVRLLDDLGRGISQVERERWRQMISEVDGRYVEAQDNLADYCSRTAEARGLALTDRSRKLTVLFLVIAAWPVVLAVGSFLSGLISTLVFFFRHRN
jgi:hypothetical protein